MSRKNPLVKLANGEWQLVQSSGDWLFIIDGEGNIIADISDQVNSKDREKVGRLMVSAEQVYEAAMRLCQEYSSYSDINHGPAADLLDDALYDEYEALSNVLQLVKTRQIVKCHTRNNG